MHWSTWRAYHKIPQHTVHLSQHIVHPSRPTAQMQPLLPIVLYITIPLAGPALGSGQPSQPAVVECPANGRLHVVTLRNHGTRPQDTATPAPSVDHFVPRVIQTNNGFVGIVFRQHLRIRVPSIGNNCFSNM